MCGLLLDVVCWLVIVACLPGFDVCGLLFVGCCRLLFVVCWLLFSLFVDVCSLFVVRCVLLV